MIYVAGKSFFYCPVFVRVCPLERPRCRRDRKTPYQPLENQRELRAFLRNVEAETYSGKFFLQCDFYHVRKNPGDIDNLLKAVLDALQDAKIIENDRNCVGISSTLNQSDDNYVVIELYEAVRDEVSA